MQTRQEEREKKGQEKERKKPQKCSISFAAVEEIRHCL